MWRRLSRGAARAVRASPGARHFSRLRARRPLQPDGTRLAAGPPKPFAGTASFRTTARTEAGGALLVRLGLRWAIPYAISRGVKRLEKYPKLKRFIVNSMKVAAAGCGLGFLACLEREPLSGRVKFYFPGVSPALMFNMAEASEKQLVAELTKEGKLLGRGDPQAAQCTRVAKRLINAAHESPEFRKSINRLNLKFKLYVVNSRKVNAFVLPNGGIFVFTGLLDAMPQEDAVATVLSHEISHALCEHSREKVSLEVLSSSIWYGLRIAAFAFFDQFFLGAVASEIVAGVRGVSVSLPHSRTCETEADVVGQELMSQACFDPRVSPLVWVRFEKISRALKKRKEKAKESAGKSSIAANGVVTDGSESNENGEDDNDNEKESDNDDNDGDGDDDDNKFVASLAAAQQGGLSSTPKDRGGKEGRSQPATAFFSTHPSNAHRREKLQERLPEALSLYGSAGSCPMLPRDVPTIPPPTRRFLRRNKIRHWDRL